MFAVNQGIYIFPSKTCLIGMKRDMFGVVYLCRLFILFFNVLLFLFLSMNTSSRHLLDALNAGTTYPIFRFQLFGYQESKMDFS